MARGDMLHRNDIFGEWRILSFEDEGSSAYVYRAERVARPGSVGALKIYKERANADKAANHQIEERIKRHIDLIGHECDYLVKILDAGQQDGAYFVAMEWIEGTNLDKSRGKIPADRVRPLLSQIATAVEYLKSVRIFHRDIKPANVIVSHNWNKATLTDLGVMGVHAEKGSVTSTGQFLGTKRYSPTEFLLDPNLHGKPETDAVNAYQVGAIAYELITRKRLFDNVPDGEKLSAAIHERRAIKITKAQVVDASLSNLIPLVEQALHKNWKKRCDCGQFIFVDGVLQPTIVFLYAGGTIASKASTSNIQNVRVIQGPDDLLLEKFTKRIKRDYQFFNPDHLEMPFAIRWEAMDPEHQILSENASLEYWQALTSKVADILSKPRPKRGESKASSEYLVGLVVLHGTDTLAYSAAALTFALTQLPCPVVLTGANQPPNEENIWEQDPVATGSDVWRNLLGSIRFLETFGHRHPEVWVSFGETVLLAMNLRKAVEPSLASPGTHLNVDTVLDEPFTFRRPEPYARYDFRSIDGAYVNNFYPPAKEQHYLNLIAARTEFWRHTRPVIQAPSPVSRAPLSGSVVLWEASPSSAVTVLAELPRDDSRVVLLIDGYSSGTFPSSQGHPAVSLLRSALAADVPIVVIAEDGLLPSVSEYHVELIGDCKIPVIRLFGVVRESAVPLLHRMLGAIAEKDWRRPKGGSGAIELRSDMLTSTIKKYLKEEQNVATLMLGDLIRPDKLRKDLHDRLEFRFSSGTRRLQEMLNGIASTESQEEWRRAIADMRRVEPLNGRRPMAILPRTILIYMLGEAFRLHELAGSGPDAMESAYELGYRLGQSLMTYQQNAHPRRSEKLFPSLENADRERLCSDVRHFVLDVCSLVTSSGIAEITVTEIHLPNPNSPTRVGVSKVLPDEIGFRLDVKKQLDLTRVDELYSVHTATIADREFFAMLRRGMPYTETPEAFAAELENTISDLYRSTWLQKLTVLDWIVVGIGRAVMVDLISYLRPDPFIEKYAAMAGRNLAAIRTAIGMDVDVGSAHELVVRYHYVPRRFSTPTNK